MILVHQKSHKSQISREAHAWWRVSWNHDLGSENNMRKSIGIVWLRAHQLVKRSAGEGLWRSCTVKIIDWPTMVSLVIQGEQLQEGRLTNQQHQGSGSMLAPFLQNNDFGTRNPLVRQYSVPKPPYPSLYSRQLWSLSSIIWKVQCLYFWTDNKTH